MQLVVPTSELRERLPGGAKVLEIPAGSEATTLEMWLEAPGRPQSLKIPKARGIGALNLVGGGRIWLVSRDFSLPWGDSSARFASEISEARKRALSVGLSGEISIVVHGEVSGTLLQVELTCSLDGTRATTDT